MRNLEPWFPEPSGHGVQISQVLVHVIQQQLGFANALFDGLKIIRRLGGRLGRVWSGLGSGAADVVPTLSSEAFEAVHGDVADTLCR